MSSQLRTLKSGMTLSLPVPGQCYSQSKSGDFLSSSRDLLVTPELLLSSLGSFLATPTGSGLMADAPTTDLLLPTPTSFLNPAFVTEEQEKFVMHFDEKIKNLMISTIKQEEGSAIVSTSDNASSYYADMAQAEEETGDDDSAMSDLEDDVYQFSSDQSAAISMATIAPDQRQSLRLERKRKRNREAARRCRERKLDRLRCLDDRATELRQRNERLRQQADVLRTQVESLKRAASQLTCLGHCAVIEAGC